jgi:DNA-binding transcriptional ArsR family regulator
MLQQRPLDELFGALADPTRRAIVERLVRGSATVSELAEPFDVSLSAIGQAIKLLESSGLVQSRKVGRARTVELVPGSLDRAEQWFQSHREQWNRRFDRLATLLDDDDNDDETVADEKEESR